LTHGYTPTGVDFLGDLLRDVGFQVKSEASARNKYVRFLEMSIGIYNCRKWADIILIDTFSSNAFNFAFWCGLFARKLGLKYINILRGGNLLVRLESDTKRSRQLFLNAERIVSPSLYLQELFSEYNIDVTYIPNPIDMGKYEFKRRTTFRPALLWVRSLHNTYNPKMAIKCLNEIKQQYPDVSLTMLGPRLNRYFQKTSMRLYSDLQQEVGLWTDE